MKNERHIKDIENVSKSKHFGTGNILSFIYGGFIRSCKINVQRSPMFRPLFYHDVYIKKITWTSLQC